MLYFQLLFLSLPHVPFFENYDMSGKLPITFCIAEGLVFEKRLPGGNADKKYDDEIMKKFLERVQPPTKAKF